MGENGVNTPPHQHALALARLLLEGGADPNDSQTLDNRQSSPTDDHPELLVEHGVGRGTATVWQTRLGAAHATPQELVEEELRSAAEKGHVGRVRLLVDVVGDVDGIGTDHPLLEGRTAHRPAAGDPALPGQLIAACPDLLGKAAELDRIEAIGLLVAIGFDLSPTGRRTPLHEAAFHGNLELVRALVELGADPTVRDPHLDSTPAGWADHDQRQDVALYLATLERRQS
jgi:ankyrin repeat protein